MHATSRVPTNADPLPNFDALGIRTCRRDQTNDLVAENGGVFRNAPLIVQDGDIRVAQTAVFNRNFDLLGPKRP
jgi:hypothetical protein